MPTTYNIGQDIAIKTTGLTKVYRYRGLISSIFSGKYSSEVYALKDFSMEVRKGEILGIIGANGSGKSTLMKVLSGVTRPTSGTAVINGKLFAAIEVSGGFNPDLTGYNNLLLTANIWGFTKEQIKRLLPAIIEFSDLKDFIHVPVKKYSSGMVSRLASSMIVHSDADVLLLDEVLNGSDLSFKHKMHNKVVEENKKGKTIVIASHTINDILSLCNRTIIINKGEFKFDGNPFQALDIYRKQIRNVYDEPMREFTGHHENTFIEVNDFAVSNTNGEIVFTMTLKKRAEISGAVTFSLIFSNNFSTPVAHTIHNVKDDFEILKLRCTIPENTIGSGNHFITVAAFSEPNNWMYLPRICNFIIKNANIESDLSFIPGVNIYNAKWE